MKPAAALRKRLPDAFLPVARLVYHRLFRFQLRVKCWLMDLTGPRGTRPIPPALLRFSVSESTSIEEFDRIGIGCARLVEQYLSFAGVQLGNLERALDFGCGCGRVIRHLIDSHSHVKFHGVDVDRKAISWCKANLKSAHFEVADSMPPLAYPGEHFDAVYAISVFTHLNEAMQDAWLGELTRVLKPAGALLRTVYGPNVTRGLTSESAEAFASTGFAHQQTAKLQSLVPDWYNTSWHSREYIVNRLERLFKEVSYFPISDGLQDMVVARRPHGCVNTR